MGFLYQIQCQLFCTGRTYCDFVVWTKKDTSIERIYPDNDFWQSNLAVAKEFFQKAVLPEIIGKFFSRPQAKVSPAAILDSDHYCYCTGPDVDDTVGCDNPECQFQWFHLSCLGLEKLPTTKYWYCPDCRKLPNRRRLIKHKTCVHNRSKTH